MDASMEGDLQGKALWDWGGGLVGWGRGDEITDWSSILESSEELTCNEYLGLPGGG